MGSLPDVPVPATGPAPRPSRRSRRVRSEAPRGVVLMASLTVLALLGAAISPVSSWGAHTTPPPVQQDAIFDATAEKGCKPPAQPTPTPKPTPTPTPSPSPSPKPTPDPSASPTPSPSPKPTRTPRPTPTPYIPPGIDVSVWNGLLDYGPIVDKGMKFVFIKATQGTTAVDARFAGNVQRARAAGLVVGAYHFFDYQQDGAAQADHFVDTAAAEGMLTDAMPLTIDVECLGSIGWAYWNKTQPRLRAMVDRVYERTGRKPIIYTSRHMWTQVMGNDPTFGDLPLWVACWRCDPPLIPVGWTGWKFWQIRPYKFPEINRTLDGNVFNGTDASLETWRGYPILVNAGARITGDRLVDVDVSAFDGQELRTSDDGGPWSDWFPWAATVQHRLSAGDGDREVRVQIRDDQGIEGPVLNDRILLDTTGPRLGDPQLALRTGRLGAGGSVPVTVTWTARDAYAGVESSSLVHDCGPGLGGEILAADARAKATRDGTTARRRATVAANDSPLVVGTVPQGLCRMTVRGVDMLGNRRDPGDPVSAHVTIVDLATLPLNLGTAWITRAQSGAVGGSVVRSRTPGASLRMKVQGAEVGIVGTVGPSRGRLRVILDGVTVATADLYAPVLAMRSLVTIVPLPDDAQHTLRLIIQRTSNPLSRGRRVDVDALVIAADRAPSPSPEPSTAP